MIPFYIVCVLWLATLTAWQVRERHSAIERMEALKLYRAHSLTDYTAQDSKQAVRTSNFIQKSMKQAYSHLGDDDD